MTYECRADDTGEGAHSGPFSTCVNACPPTPPCYWCFQTGSDDCGNPLYECRADATGEGASFGPFPDCDGGCPTPPPCDPCGNCEGCHIKVATDDWGNMYVAGCSSPSGSAWEYCNGTYNRYSSSLLAGAPYGWEWAPGYPEALGGCPYAFVSSTAHNYVKCDNRDECDGYCVYTRTDIRLFRINCAAKTAEDITEVASANGQPVVQLIAPPSDSYCECQTGEYLAPPLCEPQVSCCSGSCEAGQQCRQGCYCCYEFNGGNPGFFNIVCRDEPQACCCEEFKYLCFRSYSQEGAAALPCPDINPPAPPNAIVKLVGNSSLSCGGNAPVGGFLDFNDNNEEVCKYSWGYYTPVTDCAECTGGTCVPWFDGGLGASAWAGLCDCATTLGIDVCDNPLP